MKLDITSEGVLYGFKDDDDQDVTELIIPDGVKWIAESAFEYNDHLESVVIPDGVISIGEGAFSECTSLRHLIIPETVTYIGVDAFDCTAWMNNYPDDFVIINHILIKYRGSIQNAPEELHIPDGVYFINDKLLAYTDWQFKKLIFPDGLKSIGEMAFSHCTALEEIHLPDSIEEIGYDAFESCRLMKRVPLLVHAGKVLYRFPELHMYHAEYIVKEHDYEIELIPEAKYDLIFQMYALNIDSDGTGKYIHQHFPEMISILIRLEDTKLMQKLFDTFPDLIRNHIDTLIQEAIKQKKHKLQVMLTDYKYRRSLFRKKDWSL